MVAAPVDISQWHLANVALAPQDWRTLLRAYGKTWRRSLWLLQGLQELGDTARCEML